MRFPARWVQVVLVVTSALASAASPHRTEVSWFEGDAPAVRWLILDPRSGAERVFAELPGVPADVFWADQRVLYRLGREVFESGWPVARARKLVATLPEDVARSTIRVWTTADGRLWVASYHANWDKRPELPEKVRSHHGEYFVAVWSMRGGALELERVIPTEDEQCDARGPSVLGPVPRGDVLAGRAERVTIERLVWLQRTVNKEPDYDDTSSGRARLPLASVRDRAVTLSVDRNQVALPLALVEASSGRLLFELDPRPGEKVQPHFSFSERAGLGLIRTDGINLVVNLATGKTIRKIEGPDPRHPRLGGTVPRVFWATGEK